MSMKPMNSIDKIWRDHAVVERDGYPTILAIDCMMLHEVTSPQPFSLLQELGIPLLYPRYIFGTLDHSVPTRLDREFIHDEVARVQVETFRHNTLCHRVRIFDYGSGNQGVVHVIAPELGITQPGSIVVCGDSHTSTLGAFGTLAFGIGISEVAHVMATSSLLQYKPKTMRVKFKGTLRPGVFAKDMALKLVSTIGVGGANGHFIEYTGKVIQAMDMEERMTLCNMSIECGARGGLISPDEKTLNYLKGRMYAPSDKLWDEACKFWRSIASDPGCVYDKIITIDVSALRPLVSWGTSPSQCVEIDSPIPHENDILGQRRALAYTKLEVGQRPLGTAIQWGFVGSCTNGRISDLRVVANILRGREIAPGVTLLIVPGSEAVRAQAVEEGLAEVFEKAGARFRMPGCSMCLGMNDDRVPDGARCISSTNRNFIGRQGTGSITHLAPPATVAASALTGEISSPEEFFAVTH